jgi:hypothetical protein
LGSPARSREAGQIETVADGAFLGRLELPDGRRQEKHSRTLISTWKPLTFGQL